MQYFRHPFLLHFCRNTAAKQNASADRIFVNLKFEGASNNVRVGGNVCKVRVIITCVYLCVLRFL